MNALSVFEKKVQVVLGRQMKDLGQVVGVGGDWPTSERKQERERD